MHAVGSDIRHLKAQSDELRLRQIIDTFANIVELVNDDAACFFAMAIVLNDLTNLQRAKDPAAMIRALNQFFLNIECDGPMASSGALVLDAEVIPTPQGVS